MTPRDNRRKLGAGALLLSALLVACGDDDQGSASAPTLETIAAGSTIGETSTTSTERIGSEELQAFADDLVATTESDGGIVAIQRGADPAILVVSGVADARDDSPIRPGDAFHVASVTKSYVAAALVLLAHEGTVDLDATIDAWIEWPNGEAITVRQLLQHTSGVVSFGNASDRTPLFTQMVVDEGRVYTLDETLDATRDLEPAAAPGTITAYNNLNYVLAGAVIEAATGEPLEAVLRERLFDPISLDSTWYPTGTNTGPAPLPGLYEPEPSTEPISTADFSMVSWETLIGPASGAVSNMDDYLTWGSTVLRDQAIAGTSLGEMSDIGPGGYGLGVVGVTADGACVFDGCPPGAEFTRTSLNGDFPGSSTRILYNPATDTLLAVYLNRNALSLDAPMLAVVGSLD